MLEIGCLCVCEREREIEIERVRESGRNLLFKVKLKDFR